MNSYIRLQKFRNKAKSKLERIFQLHEFYCKCIYKAAVAELFGSFLLCILSELYIVSLIKAYPSEFPFLANAIG